MSAIAPPQPDDILLRVCWTRNSIRHNVMRLGGSGHRSWKCIVTKIIGRHQTGPSLNSKSEFMYCRSRVAHI
jgi:hypothetical protein